MSHLLDFYSAHHTGYVVLFSPSDLHNSTIMVTIPCAGKTLPMSLSLVTHGLRQDSNPVSPVH